MVMIKGIVAGLALLSAVGVSHGQSERVSDNVGTRIVGGKPVQEGQYEFIVSLQDSGDHFCGGSLVSKKYVLTAAHCVYGYPKPSGVKIGLHSLKGKGGVARKVKKVFVHPDYANSNGNSPADVAILELDSAVNDIAPVSLAPTGGDSGEAVGVVAKVIGWGVTREGGNSIPDVLQGVDVPVVSKADCTAKGAYGKGDIFDENVCAGYKKGGKDSCQGDSGGPLFSELGGNVQQIGVVSWGEGCARKNKYGVYARVSSYRSWIEKQVPDLPSGGGGGPSPTGQPTPAGGSGPGTPEYESEAKFCRKKGRNEKKCKRQSTRCFWEAGEGCLTLLAQGPTPKPTPSPTQSPTDAPTESDDYSGSEYSGGSDYSGSGEYSGSGYGIDCSELGPLDCYGDYNCNWDVSEKECVDAPAKCHKATSQKTCNNKDGCVWSNEMCNPEILEDWCVTLESKKACKKESGGSCSWSGGSCMTTEPCYLYAGSSVCSSDSSCQWFSEQGMEWCDRAYDECNFYLNKKQCVRQSGGECRWDKKNRECISK